MIHFFRCVWNVPQKCFDFLQQDLLEDLFIFLMQFIFLHFFFASTKCEGIIERFIFFAIALFNWTMCEGENVEQNFYILHYTLFH